MTDILDLQDWRVTSTRQEDDQLVIEAEYGVPPAACMKCGVIGRLYKHGPKPITIRDSPVRCDCASLMRTPPTKRFARAATDRARRARAFLRPFSPAKRKPARRDFRRRAFFILKGNHHVRRNST